MIYLSAEALANIDAAKRADIDAGLGTTGHGDDGASKEE